MSLAIVSSALAPLYGSPDVRAELVSQVALGHLLTVRETRDAFLRVRAEDGYPGWIHRGYVAMGDDAVLGGWRQEATLACLGATLSLGGRDRLVLPLGARLAPAPGGVALPDGRVGEIASGRIAPLSELREESRALAPAEWAAIFFAGAPYLFGGVTPWGVDCSGLVQVAFALRGVSLPRDSAMQAEAGEPVDASDPVRDVEAGDLLCFADEAGGSGEGPGRRVAHVGITDGDGGLVHSALGAGGLIRSPLTGNSAEAERLRRTFVRARRVERVPD